MKLDEIINAPVIKVTAKSPIKSKGDHTQRNSRPTKLLGNGYTSFVSQSTNPHEVNKTSRDLVGQYDITTRYLSYIAEHNLAAENPFFPRVYKVVLVKSNEERGHYFHFNVEKLYALTDFSSAEIMAAVERVIDIDKIKTWNPNPTAEELFSWFVDACENYYNGHPHQFLIDEHLIQALDIIKKLGHEFDMQWDMAARISTGNMMGRRTSLGLQFVIMDPLA